MYIIITGPTATGKSSVAIEVCKKMNGEVVSCDSMQVYKGMDIGTSKVPGSKMQGVVHHLIDIVEPDSAFTVSDFKRKAEKVMDDIKSRNKLPVLAGGTGLYISSLINGLFESEAPAGELKERLRKIEKEEGKEKLFEMLREKDPEEASVIDKNNPRRLIRALEIIMTHDEKVSELKKKTAETAYKDECMVFILNLERSRLYAKIDKRVDEMVSEGLAGEVRKLIDAGVKSGSNAMQAIGYKELVDHIEGRISLEDAVEEIKMNTRNYAKRQFTWFKKYKEALWLDVEGKTPEEIADEIILNMKHKT